MPDFTLDPDTSAQVTRLIGVIQLATRHPELGAFSKDALRELGDQMIEAWFAGTQLHPVLVAGWDPAHDR
jgi:hypothetical protein